MSRLLIFAITLILGAALNAQPRSAQVRKDVPAGLALEETIDGKPVFRTGGDVSSPEVMSAAEPEYSPVQKELKASGEVAVRIIVDETGTPRHARVLHGMEYTLDLIAVDTVMKYKFKPARKDGKPVATLVDISLWFEKR